MTKRKRSFSPAPPISLPTCPAPLPPSTPSAIPQRILALAARSITREVHSFLGDVTHMTIHTEKILEDAEVAAIYLRALVDKGVPMPSAIALTASYISARQPYEYKEPKEPWQNDDIITKTT